MPSNKSDWDVVSVLMGLAVFALPVTLLVPGFSISNVIPKIRIERLHMFYQYLSWPQLNAAVITFLVVLFCFYLEMRKRHVKPYPVHSSVGRRNTVLSSALGVKSAIQFLPKLQDVTCLDWRNSTPRFVLLPELDEIVENVRVVSEATDNIMEEERDRQTEAMRACMQLLDSSVEHYENLILLRDDLRYRSKPQYPPVIELSSSEL